MSDERVFRYLSFKVEVMSWLLFLDVECWKMKGFELDVDQGWWKISADGIQHPKDRSSRLFDHMNEKKRYTFPSLTTQDQSQAPYYQHTHSAHNSQHASPHRYILIPCHPPEIAFNSASRYTSKASCPLEPPNIPENSVVSRRSTSARRRRWAWVSSAF